MTESVIRVAIVDDQELIRTGFSMILGTADGIEVVGEAADGAAALALIADLTARGRAPDVVLMDVRMPGVDGIAATRRLTAEYPEIRVIVLTTFDLDEYAVEAVQAGASGFLLKDARASELIAAVRKVGDGDAVMAPSVTLRLLSRLRTPGALAADPDPETTARSESAHTPDRSSGPVLEQLTEREREVFALVAEGLSNAEIGERLFLSESTVKTHVGRVLGKLGLRDRVHAVILAYEQGLR